MDHPLFVTFVLVGGLTLALVARRRRWEPSVRTSLAVGVAFRVVVLIVAATSHWQPVDFDQGFQTAGQAVVHGRDPVLASNGSWHFLPMVPYYYGAALSTGLPWAVAGRLCTLLADVVLIVLVGKLAGPRRRRMASFSYAVMPLALMVSVIHGQIEPIGLAFLVGSYLAAGAAARAFREVDGPAEPPSSPAGRMLGVVSGRPARTTWWSIATGVLFGLALSANSWPIILLPVALSIVPTWRHRAYGLVAAGMVPLVFLASLPIIVNSSWQNLLDVARYLGGVRPVVGEWGWTALLTGGNEALVPSYSRYGQLLLYTTLAVVAYLWRKGDRVDMTSAMLLAFMLVTPRMGSQYLLWFVPFLVAKPTRWSWPAMTAATVWAGVGYLYLTQFDDTGWWIRHVYWAQASLLVIPWLALAMPWGRRLGLPSVSDSSPDTPHDLVTAT
jgi:hypothetical protein